MEIDCPMGQLYYMRASEKKRTELGGGVGPEGQTNAIPIFPENRKLAHGMDTPPPTERKPLL